MSVTRTLRCLKSLAEGVLWTQTLPRAARRNVIAGEYKGAVVVGLKPCIQLSETWRHSTNKLKKIKTQTMRKWVYVNIHPALNIYLFLTVYHFCISWRALLTDVSATVTLGSIIHTVSYRLSPHGHSSSTIILQIFASMPTKRPGPLANCVVLNMKKLINYPSPGIKIMPMYAWVFVYMYLCMC